MKRYFNILFGVTILLGAASCTEIEDGTTDIDSWPTPVKPVTYEYNITDENMGIYNKSDFERVRKSLEDGTAPAGVQEEFNRLKSSSLAGIGYTPNPLEWVVRGKDDGNHGNAVGGQNYLPCMRDATAAYQTAMLWQLTGDDQYAQTCVNILNAWVAKCKGTFSTDSNATLLAAQGYTFACAGLILRSYAGWAEADQNKFKTWMKEKWADGCVGFWNGYYDTCSEHYWSNWILLTQCCYLSVGILLNDDDMINRVVNMFYRADDYGMNNGCVFKLCLGSHTDPLGSGESMMQNQESGRDQGHATMSAAVAAQLAQLAYSLYKTNRDKPELDFFEANNRALLQMAEYVAVTNLRTGTDQANAEGAWLVQDLSNFPFQTYYYCGGEGGEGPACGCKAPHTHWGTQRAVSEAGRGKLRPNWEIYYNHYKNEKGMTVGFKYVKQFADKMRPECGAGDPLYGMASGDFDQVGWNTLMMYQGE